MNNLNWVKAADKLPQHDKWVKVKTRMFPEYIENAVLIYNDWGTTDWLIGGLIYAPLEEVIEWAYWFEGEQE